MSHFKNDDYIKSQSGTAFLEFAIMLPVLLLLIFGVIEVTRYVLITEKINNAAHTISSLAARSDSITEDDITNLFDSTQHIMDPYGNANVILSSITNDGTASRLNWQRKTDSNSNSNVVDGSGIATFPGSFTISAGETIITAEVFYNYAPMIWDNIYGADQLYAAKFTKPRLGGLGSVD